MLMVKKDLSLPLLLFLSSSPCDPTCSESWVRPRVPLSTWVPFSYSPVSLQFWPSVSGFLSLCHVPSEQGLGVWPSDSLSGAGTSAPPSLRRSVASAFSVGMGCQPRLDLTWTPGATEAGAARPLLPVRRSPGTQTLPASAALLGQRVGLSPAPSSRLVPTL